MTLEQNIRRTGLKNGVVLGIATTFLAIISFYVITTSAQSPIFFIVAPIIFKIFIPIFFVLYLCFKTRQSVGGLWTFKQATTGIFIILAAAYFVNLIGNDILFEKVIEPDSVEKIQNAAITAKTYNMKEKGANQTKINAAIADMKKDFIQKDNFSFGSVIMQNAFIILFLFVFALIFASLMRNAEYVPAIPKKS